MSAYRERSSGSVVDDTGNRRPTCENLHGPLMLRRRTGHRLLALLLVPLLVVIGMARAQAFYLCAYDSVARTACCCPQAPESDERKAPTEARIEAACCCSVEERGAVAPAARATERTDIGH